MRMGHVSNVMQTCRVVPTTPHILTHKDDRTCHTHSVLIHVKWHLSFYENAGLLRGRFVRFRGPSFPASDYEIEVGGSITKYFISST